MKQKLYIVRRDAYTVGPGGMVTCKVEVDVTAFGVLIFTELMTLVLVWVEVIWGVAAVISSETVEMLLRVVLFAFGVEIKRVVWVRIEVMIFETALGVEVCIDTSETVEICSLVCSSVSAKKMWISSEE